MVCVAPVIRVAGKADARHGSPAAQPSQARPLFSPDLAAEKRGVAAARHLHFARWVAFLSCADTNVSQHRLCGKQGRLPANLVSVGVSRSVAAVPMLAYALEDRRPTDTAPTSLFYNPLDKRVNDPTFLFIEMPIDMACILWIACLGATEP